MKNICLSINESIIMAEKYGAWSPYVYTMDNPLKYTDPTGMWIDDIIIEGSDGNSLNWTPGSSYNGDEFISQAVIALNALSKDPNTANFSFHGKKGTGVNFEGNAVLDYAKGGSKDNKDVVIKNASLNPNGKDQNEHIQGTVYRNPSLGIKEEGFNGATGSGEYPFW